MTGEPQASPAGDIGRRLTSEWLLAMVAAGVLTISFLLAPASLPDLPLCYFRAATGKPCPGCGLTRAFCAISHGRLAEAWHHNPLSFLFYAATLVLMLWPWLASRAGGFTKLLHNRRFAVWGSIGGVLAVWTFGVWRILNLG